MEQRVLIYGCGGHGRVILDALRAQWGPVLCAIFADDAASVEGRRVDGAQVYGPDLLADLRQRGFKALIGIGDNLNRARVYNRLRTMGFSFTSAVHPSAVVSPLARLADGVAVMPGAVVNTGARLEENACVNTAASVDHDAVICAHAHVFPGARLTGNVIVGCYATVGSGAVIVPGVRIGDNAYVGAGAVVLKDVPENAVAYGVPARVVRARDPIPDELRDLCAC